MSIVSINPKDLQRFRLVEFQGWHPAKIVKMVEKNSSAGNLMWETTIELQSNGKAAADSGVWCRTHPNVGATGILVNMVASAVNKTSKELVPKDSPENVDVDPMAANGGELLVHVKHTVYQGKQRNDVVDFLPIKEIDNIELYEALPEKSSSANEEPPPF